MEARAQSRHLCRGAHLTIFLSVKSTSRSHTTGYFTSPHASCDCLRADLATGCSTGSGTYATGCYCSTTAAGEPSGNHQLWAYKVCLGGTTEDTRSS